MQRRTAPKHDSVGQADAKLARVRHKGLAALTEAQEELRPRSGDIRGSIVAGGHGAQHAHVDGEVACAAAGGTGAICAGWL